MLIEEVELNYPYFRSPIYFLSFLLVRIFFSFKSFREIINFRVDIWTRIWNNKTINYYKFNFLEEDRLRTNNYTVRNTFQILSSRFSSYSSILIYKFTSRCKIIKFSQPRFPQLLGSFDNSAIYNSARAENSVSGFGENFMGYSWREIRFFNFSSTRGR